MRRLSQSRFGRLLNFVHIISLIRDYFIQRCQTVCMVHYFSSGKYRCYLTDDNFFSARYLSSDSCDEESTPYPDLKMLFQISSLNRKSEENSGLKMKNCLSRKFSGIQNLVKSNKRSGKNSMHFNSSQALEALDASFIKDISRFFMRLVLIQLINFQVMKSLPLEFLSTSNIVDLYVAILALYVLITGHFKKCDANVLREYTYMLSVLTTCCRNRSLFTQCCDGRSLLQNFIDPPYYRVSLWCMCKV